MNGISIPYLISAKKLKREGYQLLSMQLILALMIWKDWSFFASVTAYADFKQMAQRQVLNELNAVYKSSPAIGRMSVGDFLTALKEEVTELDYRISS